MLIKDADSAEHIANSQRCVFSTWRLPFGFHFKHIHQWWITTNSKAFESAHIECHDKLLVAVLVDFKEKILEVEPSRTRENSRRTWVAELEWLRDALISANLLMNLIASCTTKKREPPCKTVYQTDTINTIGFTSSHCDWWLLVENLPKLAKTEKSHLIFNYTP